jgi:hypothetical protein
VVTSFRLNHDFNIVEHHHFDDRVREILFLCTTFVFLCTTFAPSSRSTSTILRCSSAPLPKTSRCAMSSSTRPSRVCW